MFSFSFLSRRILISQLPVNHESRFCATATPANLVFYARFDVRPVFCFHSLAIVFFEAAFLSISLGENKSSESTNHTEWQRSVHLYVQNDHVSEIPEESR